MKFYRFRFVIILFFIAVLCFNFLYQESYLSYSPFPSCSSYFARKVRVDFTNSNLSPENFKYKKVLNSLNISVSKKNIELLSYLDNCCTSNGYNSKMLFNYLLPEIKSSYVNERIFEEIVEVVSRKYKKSQNGNNLLKELSRYVDKPASLKVALNLSKQGMWPQGLVEPILESSPNYEKIKSKIDKYKQKVQRLQEGIPDLDNNLQLSLYYSVLGKRSDKFTDVDYNRYKEMVMNIKNFLDQHPNLEKPFSKNKYESFKIIAEEVVYLKEMGKIIDGHIQQIKDNYEKLINVDLNQLLSENNLGALKNPLDFHKRILAYLTIKNSPNPPDEISNYTLNWFMNLGYKSNWVDEEIKSIFKNTHDLGKIKETILQKAKGGKTKLIDAIFSSSLLKYQPARNKKAYEKLQKLTFLMAESIIGYRLGEQLSNLNQNTFSELTEERKLSLLKKNHDNSTVENMLKSNVKVGIPTVIKEKLSKKYNDIIKSINIKQETNKVTDTYSFIPMKFEAIFRGYMFLDCTRKDSGGTPYAWTVHPDNMYYKVRNNNKEIGYISLSETRIKNSDQKILLIDSLQFHCNNRKVIENIINELKKQAERKGFMGIAFPKDLSISFDSTVTLGKLEKILKQQEKFRVELEYIHQDITKSLENTFGKNKAHSFLLNDIFYYLP